MKKTISLILTIVLSLVMFMTNVTGLVMVAKSEGYVVRAEEGEMQEDFDNPGEYDSGAEDTMRLRQEEEAARIEAEERAAREAEEAAKKQAEEEEAAREAQRKAEQDAERIAKEQEEAQKAEEEKRMAEQESSYSLTASFNSSLVTKLDLGAAEVGEIRAYYPIDIKNTGATAVELIYSKLNDVDGAFTVELMNNTPQGIVQNMAISLEPGQSARFDIGMSPTLRTGTYRSTLMFADATKDPGYTKALKIKLSGKVVSKQDAITGVQIYPAKATIALDGGYQFQAVVKGTNEAVPPSQDVRWSITNQRSAGTRIDENGLLMVGHDETSSTINVIATSVENDQISGTAVVTTQTNSYNVSAVAEPAGGGSVTGGGAVVSGGSVTLSAVPNKNYYFVGWFSGGKNVSTSTNFTLDDVTSNTDVTAKFAQNYVTVKVDSNIKDAGNIVGGGNVTYGSSTTLSAKAYSGYVFTGWKEGDTIISRDASLSLKNLTADRKITAMFSKTSYTITMAASPIEGGKVSGGGTIALGKGTTLKAEPVSGYEFREWQVNGQVVSRDASYKVDKVEQDYTITAIFVKKGITSYEISAGVATTGGSITPSGKTLVAEGANITYTMTPKAGFTILAVAVDGVQVGNVSNYTFTNVRGPHTIAVAFVQTQAATGKKGSQTNKVQAIPKTESNTATTESTVDINKAASGSGGDTYVEEIEGLDEVYVPTDEELGIDTDEEDIEFSSAVMKFMGVSMDEISRMVATGDTMPILDAAFYTGYLGANVTNTMEPKDSIGVDYHNMTREELMMLADEQINPSLPNLDIVVHDMLTTEDVLSMAKGGQVDIAVSLVKEDASPVTERLMKSAVGQKPLQYFDLTVLKTSGGYTEKVTEIPSLMQVVIEIPDSIYKSGKTYSILRVHNGSLNILPDIDDDPKTITFYTDRFSSYAIAREVTTSQNLIAWLFAGAAITFGIAITSFLILINHQRKMRRAKRRANAG